MSTTTLQQIQVLADQAMAGAPSDLTPYIYSTRTSQEFKAVFLKIAKDAFNKATDVRMVKVYAEVDGKPFSIELRQLAKSVSFAINDEKHWPASGHSGAPVPIYSLQVEDKKYRPLRLRRYKSLVRDYNGVSSQGPLTKKAFDKSFDLVHGFHAASTSPTKRAK